MEKLRERLAREEGFTLIELLVVIVIIGILLAIAVPSYLGFKDRANQRAADADLRSAVPSAEAYYADNGSYSGMDVPAMKGSINGLKVDHVTIIGAGKDTYCIDKKVGNKTASVQRGAAPVAGTDGDNGDPLEGDLC